MRRTAGRPVEVVVPVLVQPLQRPPQLPVLACGDRPRLVPFDAGPRSRPGEAGAQLSPVRPWPARGKAPALARCRPLLDPEQVPVAARRHLVDPEQVPVTGHRHVVPVPVAAGRHFLSRFGRVLVVASHHFPSGSARVPVASPSWDSCCALVVAFHTRPDGGSLSLGRILGVYKGETILFRAALYKLREAPT